MPQFYEKFLQGKIHQFGLYAGVRHMKNLGVSFDNAYYAAFGKFPTR